MRIEEKERYWRAIPETDLEAKFLKDLWVNKNEKRAITKIETLEHLSFEFGIAIF